MRRIEKLPKMQGNAELVEVAYKIRQMHLEQWEKILDSLTGMPEVVENISKKIDLMKQNDLAEWWCAMFNFSLERFVKAEIENTVLDTLIKRGKNVTKSG